MSVTIGDRQHPFGVLGAHTTAGRAFSAKDASFLLAVANVLGSAVARRRAQQALRESEERLRLLAENLPEVVTFYDLDMQVRYVNPAFETIWDAPRSTLYEDASTWLRPVHPDDRKHVVTAYLAYLAGETFDEVFRIRTGDEIRQIHHRLIPVAGVGGVGLSEDITEQVEAESRARELAATEAVRARDAVLAVISHDLRSPLMSITLSSRLMSEQSSDPAEQRRIRVVQRSAEQMRRLLDDLLDAAKLESGSFAIDTEEVEVEGLLQAAADAIEDRLSEASIALQLDPSEEALSVSGDRSRLLQVIDNLLGNAIKFTGPGGRIELSAETGAGEIVFSVSDSGCGIPRDRIPHLFERFWQGQRSDRRGVGLGLAICHGIVTAHGGRIWVDSTEGAGTTVRFSIPSEPSEAAGTPYAEISR